MDLDEDTQYNASEKTGMRWCILIETISLILGVFWAGKTEVEKAQEAAEFLEEPTKLK